MFNMKLMTTRQAAAALGVTPRQMARMVEDGALVPEAKGPGARGAFLFAPDVVEALRADRELSARAAREPWDAA